MKFSLHLIILASLSLFYPLSVRAKVRGLKTIVLDNPPTEDQLFSGPEFLDCDPNLANLVCFPSDDPFRPDIVLSEQLMTGFTTDISEVTSIGGPVKISDVVTFPTGFPVGEDDIRNTWGFLGAEPLGTDALLGTNVGAAIDNAGGTPSNDASQDFGEPQPFKVFFGTELTSVTGPANDFFLIDLIGDDGVDLRPLNSAGNLIGDFFLRLTSGPGGNLFNNTNLGDFGIVENFEITVNSENLSNLGLSEETIIDDVPLAGIAFDIEDFTGTGELNSLAGFEITPLNLDPSISSARGSIDILTIGYNTQAVSVPESNNIFGLLALGNLGIVSIIWRKIKSKI